LAARDFRAHALLEDVPVLYVEENTLRQYDPELASFLNVNTPEDLRRLRVGWGGKKT
jgi:molybdopterin-guanine dinucleotide biosynthesis protein A